jgi:hypothetical protein
VDEAKYLRIYLNDHLAGSSFGLSLARRIADENEGTEIGRVMAGVADEIDADRDMLQDFMKAVGARRKVVRQAIAWVGEKTARLKPNGKLVGYSPLSRYMELEMLSLGVAGKLSLWEGLIKAGGEKIEGFDIAELAKRARDQRKTIEALRLEASSDAFGAALKPSGSTAPRAAAAAR